MKLSVIFPAYNEEQGIERVLLSTKDILSQTNISHEIIVVNDGSKDSTALKAASTGVRVISHAQNKGYGAALLTGFTAAKGDVLCCLDADGTYPPQEIPRLYTYLLTHDVEMVSGSRLSGSCKGMPLIRRVGNYFLSWIATLMLGRHVSDLASGMRVFKKTMLQEILPLSDDLDFTVRMTLKAAAKKIRFKEIPIRYDERAGESKLSVSKHGKMFLQSILYVTRDYNPLRLFVPISLFFVTIAFFSILHLAIRRLGGEVSISLTNGLIITGMFFFFALQTFFFGILADMVASLRKER